MTVHSHPNPLLSYLCYLFKVKKKNDEQLFYFVKLLFLLRLFIELSRTIWYVKVKFVNREYFLFIYIYMSVYSIFGKIICQNIGNEGILRGFCLMQFQHIHFGLSTVFFLFICRNIKQQSLVTLSWISFRIFIPIFTSKHTL